MLQIELFAVPALTDIYSGTSFTFTKHTQKPHTHTPTYTHNTHTHTHTHTQKVANNTILKRTVGILVKEINFLRGRT